MLADTQQNSQYELSKKTAQQSYCFLPSHNYDLSHFSSHFSVARARKNVGFVWGSCVIWSTSPFFLFTFEQRLRLKICAVKSCDDAERGERRKEVHSTTIDEQKFFICSRSKARRQLLQLVEISKIWSSAIRWRIISRLLFYFEIFVWINF